MYRDLNLNHSCIIVVVRDRLKLFLAEAVQGEKVVFSLEQPGENLHKHHQDEDTSRSAETSVIIVFFVQNQSVSFPPDQADCCLRAMDI